MRRIQIVAFIMLVMVMTSVLPLHAAEITVGAGVGMKNVVNELTAMFARQHPGVTFNKNYAASGALAKQIENGAPCDVFISANEEWMDYLKDRRLVDAKSIAIFAHNQLVFAGKPEIKAGNMQDLLKLNQIAIGSPKSVPVGTWAMQAMKKAGIDKQMTGKLIMTKDVRECLMYAENGEVDGAFVFKTDVILAAKTAKVLFLVPQELYQPIVHHVALTLPGSRKAEAAAFLDFLKSPVAYEILKKAGYHLN